MNSGAKKRVQKQLKIEAGRQLQMQLWILLVRYPLVSTLLPKSPSAPETHCRADTVSRSCCLQQVMAVETSDGFRSSQSISLQAKERFLVSLPTYPFEAEQTLCRGRGIYPATEPTFMMALFLPSFRSLSENKGMNLWQMAASAKQLIEIRSMIFSVLRSVKGSSTSTPALLTTIDMPFKESSSLSTSANLSFFPSNTRSATMIFT